MKNFVQTFANLGFSRTGLNFLSQPTMYQENEVFQVFDKKTYEYIGTERRGEIHRNGFLHKSVNVIFYNTKSDDIEEKSQILLQKRSNIKSIYPSTWDSTCAEHLLPDESFRSAVARGVKEELGLDFREEYFELAVELNIHEYINSDENIHDLELFQTYVCGVNFEVVKKVTIDEVEVEEIRWKKVNDILKDIEENPEKYTCWFKRAMKNLVAEGYFE